MQKVDKSAKIKNMDTHYGPDKFWEVKGAGNLKFNEPLKPNDKRYVDLDEARGKNVFNRLLKPLGFDKDFEPKLLEEDENHYILFCGHRGCGKSTELNRIAQKLHRPDGYYVITCNIVEDLDVNNIEYVDILFLVAQNIVEQLDANGISIDESKLQNLKNFFTERIITRIEEKDFEAQIESGIEAKAGLPFIGALFAKMTSAFKTNSTHRDEIRDLVRNQFSIFKNDFNILLKEIKEKIRQKELGKNLLVIIDGTDRLTRADCDHIFINHASQLTQLETNFIYTVPIHLVYESNQIKNFYENTFVLPNVILTNESDGKKKTESWKAMRDLIKRRIHPNLFDGEKTITHIIEMSGGHIRELIHILQESFNMSETETFTRQAVASGIKRLQADYMRILNEKDYERLLSLYKTKDKESDDIMKNLLFNSVVLEYNDYWRDINPIVRESSEFQKKLKADEPQT